MSDGQKGNAVILEMSDGVRIVQQTTGDYGKGL